MLRNSTQRFKVKYQNSQELKSYKSLAVTPTKHLQMSTTRLKTTQQIQPQTPTSRGNHKKTESYNFNQVTPTFNLKVKEDSNTGSKAEKGLKKVAIRKDLKENKDRIVESAPSSPTQRSRVDWGEARKTTDLIKDPDHFIEHLQKNTVFFCCRCFHYVFQIQKKRHHPDCKDSFDPATASEKKQWQRLEKIVDLARYTENHKWEVEELYREITHNQYSKVYRVSYPQACSFFSLEEIVPAFVYTYEKLLRGRVYQRKGGFFDCF